MKRIYFYFPLLTVLLLDQLTKQLWAQADFVLIPGVLGVRGTQNTGMAFGMMAGKPLLLAAFTVIVLLLLLIYVHRHPLSRVEALGMGLLFGGALGNLIDRVAYGHVIDMLEPLFMRLFVFNVADAGITLGAALLMICLLFGKDETKDGAA